MVEAIRLPARYFPRAFLSAWRLGLVLILAVGSGCAGQRAAGRDYLMFAQQADPVTLSGQAPQPNDRGPLGYVPLGYEGIGHLPGDLNFTGKFDGGEGQAILRSLGAGRYIVRLRVNGPGGSGAVSGYAKREGMILVMHRTLAGRTCHVVFTVTWPSMNLNETNCDGYHDPQFDFGIGTLFFMPPTGSARLSAKPGTERPSGNLQARHKPGDMTFKGDIMKGTAGKVVLRLLGGTRYLVRLEPDRRVRKESMSGYATRTATVLLMKRSLAEKSCHVMISFSHSRMETRELSCSSYHGAGAGFDDGMLHRVDGQEAR